MDEMRRSRYRDKAFYIHGNMNSIPSDRAGDIERSATYYKLLTSIEAAMDMMAMLINDLGEIVSDD